MGGVLSIGLILGWVRGVFWGVLSRVSGDAVLLPVLWPDRAAPCVDWPELGVSDANWPNLASLEEVGRLASSSAVKRDIIAGLFTNP